MTDFTEGKPIIDLLGATEEPPMMGTYVVGT